MAGARADEGEREEPTLQELAARCREMAARARTVQQRNYLMALAKDYEEKAGDRRGVFTSTPVS